MPTIYIYITVYDSWLLLKMTSDRSDRNQMNHKGYFIYQFTEKVCQILIPKGKD